MPVATAPSLHTRAMRGISTSATTPSTPLCSSGRSITCTHRAIVTVAWRRRVAWSSLGVGRAARARHAAAGRSLPGRTLPHRRRAASELAEAGLEDIELHAVEGVAGLALEQVPGTDPELLEAALTLVRKTGHLEVARDIRNHLMAIGTVP